MARLLFTDEIWSLILDIFSERKPTRRPLCDRRQVLDGIFWILRTGAPWRDPPEEFRKSQSAWRLLDEWNGDGTLDTILDRLSAAHVDAGTETCGALMERLSALLIVPQAVGKNNPQEPSDHALGRYRCGFSTKIQIICNGDGQTST